MKRKYSKMKIVSAILGAACLITLAFGIISEASTTTEVIRYEKEADSGDTSRSIIWLSQSYGEVIAYDSALELINEFLKGNAKS
uniref:hypothetical protein n=1 Tax=Dialister hominis TaxID=2582419 RepID=UPI004028A7F4